MYIRKIHGHGGTSACFEIKSSRQGSLSNAGLLSLNGKMVAVAFFGYSGRWYVYDIDTGKEIASLTEEFYEQLLALFRVSDLVSEPNCVPVRESVAGRSA